LATFWLQKRAGKNGQIQRKSLKNNDRSPGEYSPEKAGVGGSTPSLATMFSKNFLDVPADANAAISEFLRGLRAMYG